MNIPAGARILALQEPDAAWIIDRELHIVIGGRANVVLPLRRPMAENLDTLERLLTLIDASGDALASSGPK